MKPIVAAAVIALATASPVLADDMAGIPLTLQFGDMERAPVTERATKQVSGYAPGLFRPADTKVQAPVEADSAQNGKPAILR